MWGATGFAVSAPCVLICSPWLLMGSGGKIVSLRFKRYNSWPGPPATKPRLGRNHTTLPLRTCVSFVILICPTVILRRPRLPSQLLPLLPPMACTTNYATATTTSTTDNTTSTTATMMQNDCLHTAPLWNYDRHADFPIATKTAASGSYY